MHCIISNVRTRTPLLLFARTSYFKLKRPILRKLRLHNFKFNFVARNFVISAKTFPLVPCLTSTPATDFNVKTTIRAKCYESSKIGFKPRSVIAAALFTRNIKCFQMVIPQTFQLFGSELLAFSAKRTF